MFHSILISLCGRCVNLSCLSEALLSAAAVYFADTRCVSVGRKSEQRIGGCYVRRSELLRERLTVLFFSDKAPPFARRLPVPLCGQRSAGPHYATTVTTIDRNLLGEARGERSPVHRSTLGGGSGEVVKSCHTVVRKCFWNRNNDYNGSANGKRMSTAPAEGW